jgi:hypothetical protein
VYLRTGLVLLAAADAVRGHIARSQWPIRWRGRGLGRFAVDEREDGEKEKNDVELHFEIVPVLVLLFLGMRELVEWFTRRLRC